MSWSRRGSRTPLPLMTLSGQIILSGRTHGGKLARRRKRVAGDTIDDLIYKLLQALGENPEREGLKKTPQRVAESLRFLTRGCEKSVSKLLNDAIFEEQVDEMVLVRDIELYSMC